MKPIVPTRAQLKEARVLVVGDSMLDRYWFGAVERISPEAPVPVVRVNTSKEQERLGGAANVAWNVKALGAHPSLLTAIGDDEHGRRLEKLLEKSGIETLFNRDPRLTTIVKLRVIGRSQQLLRVDFEEEPDHEVLTEMRPRYEEALKVAKVVLFSDYGKGGLTHIPDMIKAARDAGLAVLVDPKGSDYQRYKGATVITPNHHEATQAAGVHGEDDQAINEAGAIIRQRLGCQAVLITRGEKGMSLYEGEGVSWHIPTQARQVFDVTGAGDTVIGTLALALSTGASTRDAATLANYAAGVVVGMVGTATLSAQQLSEALGHD